MNATYQSKDQNWQEEKTTYWFDVDGEQYAVVESGPNQEIIDCDGCPVNTSDAKNIHLKNLFEMVTDEIRAEN